MKLFRSIYSICILLVLSLQVIVGADSCRLITPGESDIIGEVRYTASTVRSAIRAEREKGFAETKAKGIVGEFAAVGYIHSNDVFGYRYTSIRKVLEDLGCTIVENYLKGSGDTGIDDIFVVTKSDGTPNYSFKPLFHESKFSSSCALKLARTKTMCDQMSIDWLKTNMKDIADRSTGQASMCMVNHVLKIQSCTRCHDHFQEIARWLQECISAKTCYRTASVLCPDGKFTLYRITD